MSYDIDDVIYLEDGKEYYLIDKNVLDGVTYFYAVQYKGNVDTMMDNDYCFFRVDGEYLEDVIDEEIISKLVELFIGKLEL